MKAEWELNNNFIKRIRVLNNLYISTNKEILELDNSNINIIVYYGINHIKNLQDIILVILKAKPSISTKINQKNCIKIQNLGF